MGLNCFPLIFYIDLRNFVRAFILILLVFPIVFSLEKDLVESGTTQSEATSGQWFCSQPQVLTQHLQALTKKYPNITRLESIGKSLAGYDLWDLIISDNPNERALLKPQVKLVGNDDWIYETTCFLLVKFAESLLEKHGQENFLENRLIQTTEIHILPDVNPDRRNIFGVCARETVREEFNQATTDVLSPIEYERLPEAIALTNWMKANTFALSMTFVTGAKFVTHSFESTLIPDSLMSFRDSAKITYDKTIFQNLESTYVKSVNQTWNASTAQKFCKCPNNSERTKSRIASCPVGQISDLNYMHNTFELVIGISCCCNESSDIPLEGIWLDHKQAIQRTIAEAGFGVRGEVVDFATRERLVDYIKIRHSMRQSNDTQVWRLSSRGEFWRLYLPGNYTAQIEMSGYQVHTVTFEVKPKAYTHLLIRLVKKDSPNTEEQYSASGKEMRDKTLSFNGRQVNQSETIRQSNNRAQRSGPFWSSLSLLMGSALRFL